MKKNKNVYDGAEMVPENVENTHKKGKSLTGRIFRWMCLAVGGSLMLLSKGGGLTARHKPLLYSVLLAIYPPFLCYKLFCRQDGGIAPHPHHQLDFPHYPTRFS